MICSEYFGCFQFIGSRRDQIVAVVADNDREALLEYRRMWERGKITSNVANGYLFEIRGRLLLHTTTFHEFND